MTVRPHSPLAVLAALASLLPVAIAPAQTPAQDSDVAPAGTVRMPVSGGSLGGFVLPVTPLVEDLELRAARAWVWSVDDTQRLVLQGDVFVEFGSHRFRADEAVVWINRLPTAEGLVNQFAIHFAEVREPTERAGLTAGGRDLLVTGSGRGNVVLKVASLERRAAPRTKELAAAEARLATYLRRLLAEPLPSLAARPRLDVPVARRETLEPGPPTAPPSEAYPELPEAVLLPRPDLENVPIFKPGGVVAFTAGSTVAEPSSDAIVAEQGVIVEYRDPGFGEGRRLELRSERAVIFTAEGAMASLREGASSIDVSSVEGIYLEGGVVATDGEITLRASKLFYDLPRNQALAVDAVLRTYMRLRETLPIYARAEEMRQVAANQWQASEAIVSTSEFFTPHLSLGMREFTVTERPDGAWVEGEHATLRAGGVPLMWFPGFKGRPEKIPLRGLRFGYEADRGMEIETRWDLISLLALDAPPELEADLDLDIYTARGAGAGTRLTWADSDTIANLVAYGLYESSGEDKTDAGIVQQTDSGFRGYVDGDFMTAVSRETTIRGQLSWISDESFITTWRRLDYKNRRQYETSLSLAWASQNAAFEAYLKYDLDSFISNSWLLASRGYAVDRFPSVAYRRIGDSLFSDALTWSSEYRYDYMRLAVTSGTSQSLGVKPATFATNDPNAPVKDLYADSGYSEDSLMRFDTRQELAMPLAWGPLKLVPYASMRLTGYSGGEFLERYSPDFSNYRFLGAVGTRMSATFSRIDDRMRSRFLDINRVRHVIEPYATLWYGYDSLADSPLPVYDQTIEGASGAAVASVGLRQRWQTQRGGAGAWRSVDFLTIDLGAVFNRSEDDFQPDPTDPTTRERYAQSPIPRFFEWRPELSQWGSHVRGAAAWEVSDSFTLAGQAIYMLEDRELITTSGALENLALGTVGFSMRHNPAVTSFLEYRYLAPSRTELLQGGLGYEISRNYRLQLSPQYDLRLNEFRAISGALERNFPDFDLILSGGYDLVLDEVAFSVNFALPAVSKSRFGSNALSAFGQ
ncbi:MAG: hypothetical protein ACYTE2_06355 [Planctomycetota bacterium]